MCSVLNEDKFYLQKYNKVNELYYCRLRLADLLVTLVWNEPSTNTFSRLGRACPLRMQTAF